MMPLLVEAQISLADRTNLGPQKVEGRKPLSEEKFPNEPILKIRKSLSINNKCQKTNFHIAKSKAKISLWAAT
jgi:hypothetical protein